MPILVILYYCSQYPLFGPCTLLELYELLSELLSGGYYLGDYIGAYYGIIEGDTRSFSL